jgi:hypothetical protein
MKKSISENWYKLMVGLSLLMASFGFMIYSITTASAKSVNSTASDSNYRMVPVNADGSISVKLSDEQLNKIIPKNEDGSINIKLCEKQLKAMSPNAIQSVNIEQIYGGEAAAYFAYKDNTGNSHYSLGVDRNPW